MTDQSDVLLTPEQIEALDNPQLTKLYLAVRREFRDLIKYAVRVSRGSGGIPSTGNRMFWGSILFTRILVTAKSVNRLLPDPKPGEHWDFSATASLTRNLFEACLVYHWLCGENIVDDVRAGRFILFHLHDLGSRRRLFPDEAEEPEVIEVSSSGLTPTLISRFWTPSSAGSLLRESGRLLSKMKCWPR